MSVQCRETKIDWLSYTDKFHDLGEVCEQWFPYFGEPVPFVGRYGYKDRFSSVGIDVMYNGGESRANTIFTDISGQGTNTLYNQDLKLEDFIVDELIQHDYYNITRLDVAHDFFADSEEDFFPFYKMIEAFNEFRFVSKIHKNGRSCNIVSAPSACSINGVPDCTLNFGSPSSEIRLRVYNKLAERTAKNAPIPDVFDGNEVKQWIRFELQLRGEPAKAFCSLLGLHSITTVFLNVLKRYIRFVDVFVEGQSQTSPVCDWWEQFTNIEVDVKPQSPTLKPPDVKPQAVRQAALVKCPLTFLRSEDFH